MASWTDEREEQLAKLWAEGLSASQIAAHLGSVTPNAVIGKVHRLGLSGRAKPARGEKVGRPILGRALRRASAHTANSNDDSRVLEPIETSIAKADLEEIPEPESRNLSLSELTEYDCKWPTGDPTSSEFGFCGHPAADDTPYCKYHKKIAFQPASERRRRRAPMNYAQETATSQSSKAATEPKGPILAKALQNSTEIPPLEADLKDIIVEEFQRLTKKEIIDTDLHEVKKAIELSQKIALSMEFELRSMKRTNFTIKENNKAISRSINSLDLEFLKV